MGVVTPMILLLCCVVVLAVSIEPKNDTLHDVGSGEDFDDFDYELEQDDTDNDDEDYVDDILEKIGEIDQT